MSRDYVLQPFQPAVQLHIDYAKELNEQQFAAVTAPPGPALVIAGAGSGKTRTLTYRVAFLLEQGIPPERILLLTFTNKAASEMMRRVTDLLGRELPELWGGTFHSIGNRILRRHAEAIGYRPGFTILDREDSTDLIKACLGALEINMKEKRFPKADVLGDIFSMASNTQAPVTEVLRKQYDYFEELEPQISQLEKDYAARKLAANAMDFDDLLGLWLKLLREHDEVREQWQRRFQFILVDEFQDTNKLQSDLIDMLAERHKNVMVVGDDAQSIYAWRGANFLNILKFPERYADVKVYKIETNYRSHPEILKVANAAIAANVRQFVKELRPERASGSKPVLVACESASQQAAFVAQRVLELREEGADMNKMAVLYRSHFHALELQLELTRHQIPFSIASGIRFFEQAHVKDVTAYLKLTVNPKDELSFKRLVQLLPGIGAKGAEKLWKAFVAGQEAARAKDVESNTPVAVALQACAKAVPAKTAAAWAQFCATVSQLETPPARGQGGKMINLVIEAGYEDYLEVTYTNYENRIEDLRQLARFSENFPTLEDFLSQMALLAGMEAEVEQPADRDDERLRLSTIHQAKGLEFDVVFVIMLCEGLFPSSRSLEDEDAIEEERRLFYVAVTRARNELYLSYPLTRLIAGGGGLETQYRSRFLKEIPKELIEEWNLRPYSSFTHRQGEAEGDEF